ncbi:MAG: hypothetical protein HFH87_03590 [Lachnospiraceae bacterium]|nr:hypothetical protein [Lachnospiraceae bacterium]
MGKRIRTIIMALLAVCLWSGTKGSASAATEPLSFYEDGDVVGFIGDSITHVKYSSLSYVEILEAYYLSRFPGQNTEFRNVGTAGYKAVDILNIYDKDPAFRGLDKAVIMLGTNEAILDFSTEEYIAKMGELVERLKGDGLAGEDILLITPPVCDENCSVNLDKNGRARWAFEDTVLEYMGALETKAQEWGVCYLDIHTPMAELTETMQKAEAGSTLTTDGIHPNAVGQRLIAYYILQAQGTERQPLAEIFIPGEGEVRVHGGEISDYYRGEKGLCWTWRPDTYPVAGADGALQFRGLSEEADLLYQNQLQVAGLSEEGSYRVLMGEADLGSYTGSVLAEGIDIGMLEAHPQQEVMRRVEALSKARHQNVVKYRDVWIEIAMQRAVYIPEEVQAQYERWKAEDDRLQSEMHAVMEGLQDSVFRMYVIEEGVLPEEMEQEAEAAEEARKAEEEAARKAAEEQARREEEEARAAEEEAARKAEEEAARREEEAAAKAAEEAARKEAEAQALLRKGIVLGTGAGVSGILVVVWIWRRRRKRRESKAGEDMDNKKDRSA